MKKLVRWCLRGVFALFVVLICLLVFVKFQYGLGQIYPDPGSDNSIAFGRLEKLIRLDFPPGNLAVGANGHVYFNYHPIARVSRFAPATVFEWADGVIKPFPSAEMQKEFQGTFGMTIDKQGRLWLVEPATFDFEHTRLWAFDLATRQKVKFFEFPGHAAQFAQDLRVTADGKHVLLADPGVFRFVSPKLYEYSVDDNSFRVVLDGPECILPEDWVIQTPFGPDRLLGGLLNFSVGLDGIEISDDQKWVDLAAMTSSRLCRIPLTTVINHDIAPAEAAIRLEEIGKKPMSDGITVNGDGHIVLTDVEHGGLMMFDTTSRKLSTLARSKEVVWADGVVTGPGGALYFTDSAIPAYLGQLAGPPDRSKLEAHRPYFIYKLSK